jgi:hypothetical protein
MCGESRMHGDNGGDGKTPFGCASCPYPLRTGGTVTVPTVWGPRGWIVSSSPAAERGALGDTSRPVSHFKRRAEQRDVCESIL